MNRSYRRTAARDARRTEAGSARHRARGIAAVGSAAALASAGAGAAVVLTDTAAHANPVLEVTNTDNGGPGSLRQAILDANSTPGQDEIRITAAGTVTLTSNLPTVTNDGVSIVGPGSGSFTVDGQDSFSTIRIDVVTSGTVSLSGLTVTGALGSGVYVGSTTVPVTISDVVSTANDWGGCGGGFTFYTDPTTITLTDVVSSDNTSICYGPGIWIHNDPSGDEMVVDISNSTITGNSTSTFAGGVAVYHASVTITDTTISDNSGQDGGGVWARVNSTLTLERVTITGNSVDGGGGGVLAQDTDTTITDSTISDNSAGTGGGGVVQGTSSLTVTGTTISGNTSEYYGGGLYLTNSGTRTIANSTISGNHAGGRAGGLMAGMQAPTTLLSSTVTANTADRNGDGIVIEAPGTLIAKSSIIAGNGTTDVVEWNLPATMTSDHSLLGLVDAGVTVTDAGGTRSGVTAPQLALGPLADNGGPTLTHALLAGSVAIDTGGTTAPTFPGNAWDQRGQGYARVENGLLDVGAYEVQLPRPGPVPDPTFTG